MLTAGRLVALLLMVFGLQACAAFTGVTPTNLEPILVGAQRADVEAVLGDPSEQNPNGCGSVDTYRYNRGRKPEPALVGLGMVHPAAPLVVGLISHPFLYYGQKGELDVVYDPEGTVIKYGPRDLKDWESLFSNNHLWVDQTTAGDVAEHYYRIGMAEDGAGETARHCLCHAARLGHRSSQLYLAEVFAPTPEPVGQTPAMALAGFETSATNAAAPSISETITIESGDKPPGDDGPRPPIIPAHVIAGACHAPNETQARAESNKAKPPGS